MVFEELVLHNFGVYKGRHVISLSPRSPSKPVILVGALNGSGKTTFLDALQLAMYGKFADTSNRGGLSYSDYLRRTINRDVDPREGAALEIEFKYTREGNVDTFRIVRTWCSTGKGVRENAEVFRNGVLDPVMTENWYEYVDEFMPAAIAKLFFFDGEKIEALADPDNSAKLLRTGLHALLGLDLVEQLSNDLRVIENRRRARLQNAGDRHVLQNMDAELQTLERRRSDVRQELAAVANEIDSLAKQERSFLDEFRKAGGEIYEKREILEVERRGVTEQLQDAEAKLRELANGDAPFMLVAGLLARTRAQAETENTSNTFLKFRDYIKCRDASLLKLLSEHRAANGVETTVREFLERDLEAREKEAEVPAYLAVAPEAFRALDEEQLVVTSANIVAELGRADRFRESLSLVDRKFASMPDPEALAGMNSKIEAVRGAARELHVKYESVSREADALDRLCQATALERQRHLERTINAEFMDATTLRVLTHSEKARETLGGFRDAVARRHLSRLEASILESFQLLLRKESLVSGVSIDGETYNLTLFDQTGKTIRPERLSAGERQLLAVAVIWGLAKASGRPLPCVVDTPLGRLDSNHRRHLVEHYFPYASHQVILLSTDEEIDGVYRERLKGAIGREYLISYDEGKGSSVITSGYFN